MSAIEVIDLVPSVCVWALTAELFVTGDNNVGPQCLSVLTVHKDNHGQCAVSVSMPIVCESFDI